MSTRLTVNFVINEIDEFKNYKFYVDIHEDVNDLHEADEILSGLDKSDMMLDNLWDSIYDFEVLSIKHIQQIDEVSYSSANRKTKSEMNKLRKQSADMKLRRKYLRSKLSIVNNIVYLDDEVIDIDEQLRKVRTSKNIMLDNNMNIIATTRIAMRYSETPIQLNDKQIAIHRKHVDYVISMQKFIAHQFDHNDYDPI